ncbi:MAG: hypothetical protein ACI9V8_000295 [Urechidicola sp.]|jgi:hypothetical protein
MNNIKDHIRDLEEKLLHADVQKNPEILDDLLSKDFEEIGSIGKTSSREEVVHWLLTKEKNMQWSLDDFRIRELAPDLILAIYQANIKGNNRGSSKGSIRSSIWKLCSGNWKIIFHQGTKIT